MLGLYEHPKFVPKLTPHPVVFARSEKFKLVIVAPLSSCWHEVNIYFFMYVTLECCRILTLLFLLP